MLKWSLTGQFKNKTHLFNEPISGYLTRIDTKHDYLKLKPASLIRVKNNHLHASPTLHNLCE